MKIKQINDPHNLIHSVKLLKINEYDYKLIVLLNSFCEPFKLHGSTILNIHDEVNLADIEFDFCGNQYEEYRLHKNGVIAYIFDNSMKTKLCNIVNNYENGELV